MMLQSEIVASQKQELHALFSDAQNYTSTLLIPPLLGWDEGKIDDRMRRVYISGVASFVKMAAYPVQIKGLVVGHREFRSGLATIIYDDEIVGSDCEKLFHNDWIQEQTGCTSLQRGTAIMFEYQGLELVYKQYHRGGLIGRLIAKTYRYRRLKNTRVWREFHMLHAMRKLGLPVPRPIAAHCLGLPPLVYRCAVITERVPDSQNLTEILCEDALDNGQWGKLGALIAHFHNLNVFHADLNTSNILLTGSGEFYLVDFDKGAICTPLSRQNAEANVSRLRRSLDKLQGIHPSFHFSEENWQALTSSYQRAIQHH